MVEKKNEIEIIVYTVFFFFLSPYVVLNDENNFLFSLLVMLAFSIYNDNDHFDTALKNYKLN